MSRTGRYEVESEIGRGTTGVVYLARDPRVLRQVAIKRFTLPDGLSPEQRERLQRRFLREAQTAGRLSHPGIVTIYDVDLDPERDLPFIAMEYVPGRSLRELMTELGRVPPRRAIAMIDTVAAALESAHAAGIVHRDVKPANILVRATDGALKIVDFGIARLDVSELTKTGTAIGSPAYMAPEQFRGEEADARSDLFSLAVILYQMVAGERPFSGDDLPSIAYAVVHRAHPPLRERPGGLPAVLDSFFDRALAKARDARFQTAAEFRAGLVACLEDLPPDAAPPPPAEPPRDETPALDDASRPLDPAATAAIEFEGWTAEFRRLLQPLGETIERVSAGQERRRGLWILGGSLLVLATLVPASALWRDRAERPEPLDRRNPRVLASTPAAGEVPEGPGASSEIEPAGEPGLETSPRVAPVEQDALHAEGAARAATAPTPAEATPRKASTAPKPVPASKESAPPPKTVSAEPSVPPAATASEVPAAMAPPGDEPDVPATEEAAGVPPGEPAELAIVVHSAVKEGRLTVLADGATVYTHDLVAEDAGFKRWAKKAVRKAQESTETAVALPAGAHRVIVRLEVGDGPRVFEETFELELGAGESRRLRIDAGRGLVRRLTVALE